jgi:dTDP-4-dehydrorhamnose reductase
MKVLITGANGLVGRAVVNHCAGAGDQIVSLDHAALDITDKHNVNAILDRETPDAIINCAAWTDVDSCELDSARAQNVNALAPELLAVACRRLNALLITISTDYVFDGRKNGFYTQRDQPNPQSAYALSKLEGERRAQAAWARSIVVRSGYIFGSGGANFLSSILGRAGRGERVRAINDSFGTPTYASDLARRLRQLAQLDLPGIYHVVNAGEGASFEQFARRVVQEAGLDVELVEGIEMSALKRPALRPHNSRLRCLWSERVGLKPLQPWTDALRDFVTTARPAPEAKLVPQPSV